MKVPKQLDLKCAQNAITTIFSSVGHERIEDWSQSFNVQITILSRAPCSVSKGDCTYRFFEWRDVIDSCNFYCEMEQVALDNVVIWTLKLCDQTSLVPYSTENRSTIWTIFRVKCIWRKAFSHWRGFSVQKKFKRNRIVFKMLHLDNIESCAGYK